MVRDEELKKKRRNNGKINSQNVFNKNTNKNTIKTKANSHNKGSNKAKLNRKPLTKNNSQKNKTIPKKNVQKKANNIKKNNLVKDNISNKNKKTQNDTKIINKKVNNVVQREPKEQVQKQSEFRKNKIDLIVISLLVIFASFLVIVYCINHGNNRYQLENVQPIKVDNPIPAFKPIEEPKEETIEITTAGDCTLGADTSFGYNGQFDWWFKNKAKGNYGYFFEKVKYLFENDDYSYVNLEGTLTTYNKKTSKKYNFKGDPKYTNILLEGSIEGVNIANNHSNDYGTTGYNDTKKHLTNAGIDYFGHDSILIKEIKGKKIAFVGYTGVGLWTDKDKDMANTIKKLKNDGIDLVIANFHWGIEYSHSMSSVQKKRAHLAIDSGADIVIGSHPHCLQGMEMYKGKYIVYSLGNFVFGGNSNPKQIGRECIIVKMFIHYVDDELESIKLKVIPCSISSTKSRNNYQPMVATESETKRMIKLINKYSINYKYQESEA